MKWGQVHEGTGSQAAGSTSTTLSNPKKFTQSVWNALKEIRRKAKPGDELTFYYRGHGGGGPKYGSRDQKGEDSEKYDEHIDGKILDDQLAAWLGKFDPGVSITLLLDTCFGGGFAGGGDDVKEGSSVQVIGVGNTCPSTGSTLTDESVGGCKGDADLDGDGDGIVSALELKEYLRSKGWDVRAPYDTSSDLSFIERLKIWGNDLDKWAMGASVKPFDESDGSGIPLSFDSPEWCTYGGGTTFVPFPTTPSSIGLSPPPEQSTPPPSTSVPPSPPAGDKEDPTDSEPPKQPPQTAGDEEDPTDSEPPRQPPQTPLVKLTVKAKQTVLKSGSEQSVAMPEAMIKLDIGAEPELPLAGNDRDDAGYDESPVQGLTGADGTLTLEIPASIAVSIPASYTPSEVEVDLTTQGSTIVKVDIDPDMTEGTQPASYLHPDLHEYIVRSFIHDGAMFIVLNYPKDRTAAVNELIALSSNVEYAEENYCRDKQAGPNDPYFASKGSWGQSYDDQWAIKRVGFTAGRNSAWQAPGKKAKPVVVAVIDTGLDWNHQDFTWSSIWKNKDEIPDNGIDDDDNGYIDDVIGWDFWRNTNKPWDRDGHGTFVTGVIAATQNNGVGIAGINPQARIMVLKALNNFGHTRASYLAETIIYAANNGAQVISMSVGGKNLTRTEKTAIDYAHSRGVVTIVAGGNEGINVDEYGMAGMDHVITVAASDYNDRRTVFSNWGSRIDIAAPGTDVLGPRARRTDLMRDIPGVKYTAGEAFVGPDTRYYRASGTSFSVPIIAGTASLILSRYPNLTNTQVKRLLLQSAKDIETPGWDQYTGYGILDARAALSADPDFFILSRVLSIRSARKNGKQVVEVTGTADADHFKRAWIEIGKGENPTEWKKVTLDITKPVKLGVVGEVAAGNLRGAKVWIIRLVTEHNNGQRREARYKLKLG